MCGSYSVAAPLCPLPLCHQFGISLRRLQSIPFALCPQMQRLDLLLLCQPDVTPVCRCLLRLWCASPGVNARIPTTHSVLLSSVVGPLGLLSHQVTKVGATHWLIFGCSCIGLHSCFLPVVFMHAAIALL